MTLDQHKDFTEWVNSDNVIKLANDAYVCQCSQYRIEMSFNELADYFKREYINI